MKKSNIMTAICGVLLFCIHSWCGASSEVKLNSETRKQLNNLFFDILHAEVNPFQDGQIKNADLIQFGIFLNGNKYFNRIQPVSGQPHEKRLAARYIHDAAHDYFGKTIHDETTQGFIFKHGFYYWSPGDAGSDEAVHVTKLLYNGGDVYTAYYDAGVAQLKRIKDSHRSRYIILGFRWPIRTSARPKESSQCAQ